MPRGASITAEAVCFFRAIETRRPEQGRVLSDPFARHFLRPSWRAAADSPWVHGVFAARPPLLDLALGGMGPSGLQRFVAARHRFIDDALVDFLARGGEQVVILGAGFDARALRFGDTLGERPLFEVDFPATQALKRKVLDRAVARGHIASEAALRVSWLPIDFERTTLERGLSDGAFRKGVRTFWAWEGVSMYLRPETVHATLMTLAALSGPGSELALDLWCPPAGAHPMAFLRRATAQSLALIGEPLRFSLQPEEVHAFFGARGFRLIELLDAAGLARRYGLVESAVFSDICVARLTT